MKVGRLRFLLETDNANPNEICENTGWMPLHLLSHRQTNIKLDDSASIASMVDTLIEFGADVNGLNQNGHTPLHCAGICSIGALAKQLIKNGADVNAVEPLNNQTPLMCAVQSFNIYNDVSTLKTILQPEEIDLELRSVSGQSAMDMARTNSRSYAMIYSCKTAHDFRDSKEINIEEARLCLEKMDWMNSDNANDNFDGMFDMDIMRTKDIIIQVEAKKMNIKTSSLSSKPKSFRF